MVRVRGRVLVPQPPLCCGIWIGERWGPPCRGSCHPPISDTLTPLSPLTPAGLGRAVAS